MPSRNIDRGSVLSHLSFVICKSVHTFRTIDRDKGQRTKDEINACRGWKQLVPPESWCRGPGRYPIDAYSEFMPPPRIGVKPYRGTHPAEGMRLADLFHADDPFGWQVSEFEEARELRPGLLQIAKQVVGRVGHILGGEHAHGMATRDLTDNAYWPAELAESHWKTAPRSRLGSGRIGVEPHPRRQGARALDLVRRQRARTGQAVLAWILDLPQKRNAGRDGN